MIRFLKGKIIETAPMPVLENQGIGYQVFCAEDFSKGKEARLWIYHHIREDRQELYGFTKKDQLYLFEMLLQVSGVGPKVALMVCKNLETDKIKRAIMQSEVEVLASVPGIGKKVATKIIVELKSRLDKLEEVNIGGLEQSSEIIETLKSLGYSQSEIYAILKKVPSKFKDIQEQITWVIRNIGKNK